MDHIEILLTYLQRAREALLWKLEGLSEYDLRRPMTPTGSNLLGIVKHVSAVEQGYLRGCFGLELTYPTPYLSFEAEPNEDMWVTLDESSQQIVDQYRAAATADDDAVRSLGLDAVGYVPWWPEADREPTMMRLVTHVIAETHRHVGHADLLREMIDGAAGLGPLNSNLPVDPTQDAVWWADYVERLEQLAQQADGHSRPHPSPAPSSGFFRLFGRIGGTTPNSTVMVRLWR
ncbi:DinB family protein [Kocuria sp. JC486]|uniref:DinB family protein n=1 Tax=Kocuria sp. JC486 TaxID=1970736 RepID=UPI001422CC84|nr:DinB family protein [Kocuria sp. JC486]NHU86027.1 DinB family protein [Kocuria sp. JC486]